MGRNDCFMTIENDNRKEKCKAFRFLIYVPILLLVIVMTAWGIAAIYFSNLPTQFLRLILSILFPCIIISIFWQVHPFRRAFLAFLILFGLVLCCWLLIPPSNNRQWQPMSEVLCYADINGDDIVIHNIRNFNYRSVTDFTPQYYDKTFLLSSLKTVDLYLIYWGPTLVAHTIMSFGFGEQGYVSISIETRKEIGEEYSAIKGFFKQYELIYVVADERDLVGLRTHIKNEDVYLYRLKTDPQVIRNVFLDYFQHINQLLEKPKWYNALTHNCTTTIRGHALPHTENRPLDWRLIINGFLDEMLYERNDVDTSLSLAELRKQVYINDKAVTLDLDEDFSSNIRLGLPGMEEVK